MSFQEFLEQTNSCYNAELESVDFRNKYEEARIQINSWVEKQTQGGSHSHTISSDALQNNDKMFYSFNVSSMFLPGKIKDVLSEGTLSTETTLVLVNAIYFMGSWDIPFLNSDTHDAQFKLTMVKPAKYIFIKQKLIKKKKNRNATTYLCFC